MRGKRDNMTVELLPEQDKERITCEYIRNADILKFSFPARLAPEELRGRIEVVAREFLANGRAPDIINVNASHNSICVIVDGSNNNTSTAKNNSTARAGAER